MLVLMGIAAIVFGWRPGPGVSWPLFATAILVGTAAFAGLGLALAGTLRAEATLTLANALFIGCLLLGGVVIPLDHLPPLLAAVAGCSGCRPGGGVPRRPGRAWCGGSRPQYIEVGLWAVAAIGIAVRWFRWE